MALPVDPRIEALLTAARGQVAQGNARRNQLAILSALGLTDAGLLERSGAFQAGSQSAGFAEAPDLNNVTYGVTQGPQGRAFRQAYQGIDSSAAARGAGYGSSRQNATFAATTALQNQINAGLRGFDAQQTGTLTDQANGLSTLGQSIGDIRFEQAREAAAAPPPAPAAPAPLSPAVSTALTAARTPAGGSGGSGDNGAFKAPSGSFNVSAWGRTFTIPNGGMLGHTGPVIPKAPTKKAPAARLVRR